jgi:hypothetical protein
MNVIMSILRNVAYYCRGRLIGQLDSKPVVEVFLFGLVANVLVFREQPGRKITQFRRASEKPCIARDEQVAVQIGGNVRPRCVIASTANSLIGVPIRSVPTSGIAPYELSTAVSSGITNPGYGPVDFSLELPSSSVWKPI